MQVFLSWSGERSHAIALALRRWLPKVLPQITCWISVVDIDAGEDWSDVLVRALADSQAAIVVITPENVKAPWILFESGALARRFGKGSLVPYLVDVQPSQLPAPLSQFQTKSADRAGTLDIVRRLNRIAGGDLTDSDLAACFSKRWSWFSARLKDARPAGASAGPPALAHLTDATVGRFDDPVEYDLYLAARIRAAEKVRDLTWKDEIGPTHDLPARRDSLREYEQSIAWAAQRIPYQEIFVFNDPRRIEMLQRRLKEKHGGYSCRYFEVSDAVIPRVQFILFDEEEVAFGSHGSNVTGVVVRSMEVARIMTAYFDDLWLRARVIKAGEDVDDPTVARLVRAHGRRARST